MDTLLLVSQTIIIGRRLLIIPVSMIAEFSGTHLEPTNLIVRQTKPNIQLLFISYLIILIWNI